MRPPYDGPPHFDRRTRGGVRKIGRKYGFPRQDLWDFVHSVWLRVHDHWIRVPRVEPSKRKYIFRVAVNLAIDIRKRLDDDALTGAVLFSSLPEGEEDAPAYVPRKRRTLMGQWKEGVLEWQAEFEESQRDDRKGTAQPVQLSIEDRIRAHRAVDQAVAHDAEAAVWLLRRAVGDETYVEIGENPKEAERVKKRVSRLIDRLESEA